MGTKGYLFRLWLIVIAAFAAHGCVHFGSAKPLAPSSVSSARLAVLRQAQVWSDEDVALRDLKLGPQVVGGFAAGATVECDYVEKKSEGLSPKFFCEVAPGDVVKVKYGRDNGEVYGEVAATRLLWALGFPADAMYPVQVVCRGCPPDPTRNPRPQRGSVQTFDAAAIEREIPGIKIEPDDQPGWAWPELDLVDEKAGGAPLAHRDALRLLAVFLQHTDAKPEQQRLLCPDDAGKAGMTGCQHPIAMINDLGLTFGRANKKNTQSTASVNLAEWSQTPIWRDEERCVGNLPKSYTGTLNNPTISEAGRRFLADLLLQLSDAQLRDLFETARMPQREGISSRGSVDQWVAAFQDKRNQIVNRKCSS